MDEGALFIVSTPIGNLEDITLRALRVLRECDLVAAEDTRHSRILLDRHGIDRPLTSLHEHNEEAKIPSVLAAIRGGKKIALITDAGTPVMSDPGYRLIRAAREAGLKVEVIPGASAILAAVAGAGLAAEAFAFVGFPPRKPGERERWAKRVLAMPTAIVFFESPHRVVATLRTLAEISPTREAAVARELTKKHEEFVRDTIEGLVERLAARDEIRGEVTVVLEIPGTARVALPRPLDDEITALVDDDGERTERSGPTEDPEEHTALADVPDYSEERTVDVEAEIARLKAEGHKDKEIAKEIGRLTGRPAREIYADLVARKT